MTTHVPSPALAGQRRMRSVYSSLRKGRPALALVAAELGLLALVALAVAGLIGLRALHAVAM